VKYQLVLQFPYGELESYFPFETVLPMDSGFDEKKNKFFVME